MKFALAILTFALFAFFFCWGILLLIGGSPWLLICTALVFAITFAKYGCHAH